MVKTPRTRHSKTRREPVTIELEPGSVSRTAGQEGTAAAKPSGPASADTGDGDKAGKAAPPAAAATSTTAAKTPPPGEASAKSPSAASPERPAGATAPTAAKTPPSGDPSAKSPSAASQERPSGATAPTAAKIPPSGDASAKPTSTASEDRPAAAARSAGASKDKDTPPGAAGTFGRGATGAAATGAAGAAERSQPRSSSSRAPVFVAGIVGGVVALAAAGVLQYSGVLGAPGERSGAAAPDTGQIEAEIASLRSEIAVLQENAGSPGADSSRVDELTTNLGQLSADVDALRKAVESGEAGDSAGLDALGNRIGEIETRVSALAENAGGAAAADIDAIRQQIAGVEALARSAGEANSGFDGRLGAFEQRLDDLAARVEAQSGQPKIALAIASSALKSAVERGVPFQSELETFAAIALDAAEIAELRAYAENGVATRDEIVAGTDAAADAMIAAASPPRQDAGFFERLLTSAESLVSVRPIGSVEGPGVPETVARMEVAIQAGDLDRALDEYAALPEASQAAGASFADMVRARMEVERLVDQAVASAMQAE